MLATSEMPVSSVGPKYTQAILELVDATISFLSCGLVVTLANLPSR
jgi:hypothetical protein